MIFDFLIINFTILQEVQKGREGHLVLSGSFSANFPRVVGYCVCLSLSLFQANWLAMTPETRCFCVTE